jgi:hypothetical protein
MKYVFSSLVALGLVGSTLGLTTAQAAKRYGVVCVYNRTNVPINFQTKVGDGQWEQYTLEPNGNRFFWHEYQHQNENRSPPLLVRFDSDLTKARYNLEYRLERRAAEGNSCGEGKPYAFEYEPNNRNFIDLKAR